MAFCKKPARVCARGLFFLVLLTLFPRRMRSNFMTRFAPIISRQFERRTFKESKGSVAPSAEGILMSSESNRYALLKLNNDAPGTDESPLLVNVRLRIGLGNEGYMMPGLFVFWDSKNYAYVRGSHDTHVYWGVGERRS